MLSEGEIRPAEAGLARPALGRILVLQAERYGLIVAWVLMLVVFSILKPETFFTWPNISTILGSQAVLVVVTLGLIIPLTANDFDVSIAYVMTLSSMTIAVLNVNLGVPIGWAILGALALGVVVGLVNGFFITVFRIHSLIVTLGVGTFLHGLTLWMSNSMTISGISSSLINAVIVIRVLGIPLEFYYAIGLALIIWYLFEYTALGRRILFVGRGREVARLSGIDTDRIRRGCLVASSLLGRPCGRALCGNPGCGGPGLGHVLPAAGLRRRLPRLDQHPARPLQPLGLDDRRLFPRHRHHRPDFSRLQLVHPGHVLRRRPDPGRDPLAARPRPPGAAVGGREEGRGREGGRGGGGGEGREKRKEWKGRREGG